MVLDLDFCCPVAEVKIQFHQKRELFFLKQYARNVVIFVLNTEHDNHRTYANILSSSEAHYRRLSTD